MPTYFHYFMRNREHRSMYDSSDRVAKIKQTNQYLSSNSSISFCLQTKPITNQTDFIVERTSKIFISHSSEQYGIHLHMRETESLTKSKHSSL